VTRSPQATSPDRPTLSRGSGPRSDRPAWASARRRWVGGEAVERCWSSNPPAPSTIVASTRFTMPRLRTSRARWAEVTSRSGTPLWRVRGSLGLVDGTRGHSRPAIGRSP
jgi:hypothetical protein